MSSFLRSLKNAAAAASDALLGRGGGGASAKPRPACQYGAKCYRKNPQHRIDESHPGDDDHDTPAGSRSRPVAPAAPAADDLTAAPSAAAAEQEDEAAAPCLKKAPSRRRGAAAAVAASEPASLSASASAAESSPAACVSPPPTNALPVPQLSPTSTGSSPRVDKKMSVRDRRRRAQLEAAASSTPSPVASPPPPDENVDASATAAPASLPPLSADSSAACASSSPSTSSLATPASDDVLLASLHALHHSPSSLVPEFVEIRWESPAQAASNRGDFFIGRASAGGAAKAADGTVVSRVHLPLASSTPRLAKMISRVHARISWTRTPLLTPAQQQQQRDGTHGLIKKRPGAGGDSASADQPPPAYTYKFFIVRATRQPA